MGVGNGLQTNPGVLWGPGQCGQQWAGGAPDTGSLPPLVAQLRPPEPGLSFIPSPLFPTLFFGLSPPIPSVQNLGETLGTFAAEFGCLVFKRKLGVGGDSLRELGLRV